MKISNFDRATARVLREEMNQAFKSIEAKYGITLSAGNISFSNNEASIKVKANTIGDNGQVETKEARNWGVYAEYNGLGGIKVGDTIDLQGKSFSSPKNEYYPIPQQAIDRSFVEGEPTLTQDPNY